MKRCLMLLLPVILLLRAAAMPRRKTNRWNP